MLLSVFASVLYMLSFEPSFPVLFYYMLLLCIRRMEHVLKDLSSAVEGRCPHPSFNYLYSLIIEEVASQLPSQVFLLTIICIKISILFAQVLIHTLFTKTWSFLLCLLYYNVIFCVQICSSDFITSTFLMQYCVLFFLFT